VGFLFCRKKTKTQSACASCLAILTISDVSHLKWMLDARMAAFLADGYHLTQIGSYYVWLRHPPDRV